MDLAADAQHLRAVLLAYTGLELGPVLGDEIQDSARSVRRATLIAGVLITLIYIAGSAALLVSLPASQISAISGIPQAMEAIGATRRHAVVRSESVPCCSRWPPPGASGPGSAARPACRSSWVWAVTCRNDLGAIHPKYGSPHVALLVQAGAVSLVLLAAISGSTIHEAFQLLNDMTAALNCVVWVYIFASLLVLRARAAGKNDGIALIPGGFAVCALVAVLGASVSAFATVVAMIPPEASANPALFLVKGIGGCALIFAIGFVLCRRAQRRKRLRTPPGAFGIEAHPCSDASGWRHTRWIANICP